MRRELTIAAVIVVVFAVAGAAAFLALARYSDPPIAQPAPEAPVQLDETIAAAESAMRGEAPSVAEDSAPPAESVEDSVVAARDELRQAYASRTAETGPIEPVEEELGVIEGAVVSILEAISSNPDDPGLREMLVMTYRNEVRLLKKALRLSDDEVEAAFDEETVSASGQG